MNLVIGLVFLRGAMRMKINRKGIFGMESKLYIEVKKGLTATIVICMLFVTLFPFMDIKAGPITRLTVWTSTPTRGTILEDNMVYQVPANTNYKMAGPTTGNNGLIVRENATAVIFIPKNSSLTVYGGDGNNSTPGGAAIRVPSSSTLIVTGKGTLNAYGGAPGNGQNGGSGSACVITDNSGDYARFGSGGTGGPGGGGAGAAIGGNGGTGGTNGGAGGSITGIYHYGIGNSSGLFFNRFNITRRAHYGAPGSDGSWGYNGESAGTIYFFSTQFSSATSGYEMQASGGRAGTPFEDAVSGHYVGFTGGAGGGGGGAGSSADIIGGGGAGGGAGGGGAAGSMAIYDFSGGWRSAFVGAGSGGGGSSRNGSLGLAGNPSLALSSSGGLKLNGNQGSSGNRNGASSGGAGVEKWEDGYRLLHGPAGGNGGGPGASGGAGTLYSNLTTVGNRQANHVTTNPNIQYTITFRPEGATTVGTTSENAVLGLDLPKITTPTRTGYTFQGYYDQANGKGMMYYDSNGYGTREYEVVGNTTLYAHWKPTKFTYNTPASVGVNGITATVSHSPSSSSDYLSSVASSVQLSGTALKSGVHLITLSSAKLGNNYTLNMVIQVAKSEKVSNRQSTTFTVPAFNTNDIKLTHRMISTPDLFNQTYTYDQKAKPYSIPSEFNDIKIGTLTYTNVATNTSSTAPPINAGEYDVLIPMYVESNPNPIYLTKHLSIVPKTLEWDVSSVRANNKEYDGNTNATASGQIKVSGVISGDNITLANATITKGTFENMLTEKNKLVVINTSLVSLAGTSRNNYVLPSNEATVRADIKGITPSGKIKNDAPTTIYNGTQQPVKDIVDFYDPNVTSVILDGDQESNITYQYYSNSGMTQVTTASDGALEDGGAPKNAGKYWVKAIYTPSSQQAQYETTEIPSIPYVITPNKITPDFKWEENQPGYTYDNSKISHEYVGKALKPKVIVYESSNRNKILEEDKDYKLTYEANTSSGDAKLTIDLINNYSGKIETDFAITKATYDLSTITFKDESVEYDKRAHNIEIDDIVKLMTIDPKLSVSYNYKGIDGTAYESTQPPTEVGTYEVLATIQTTNNNYKFAGTDPSAFVMKAKLKIVYFLHTINFDFDGGELSGKTTLEWNDAAKYTLMKDYVDGIPEPVKNGYQLSGWESDGVIYSGDKIGYEEIQKDRAYKAIWKQETIQVQFDANDGTFLDGSTVKTFSQPYLSKLEFSKVALPSKEHKKFIGWATTKTATQAITDKEFTFSNTTQPVVYYAVYEDETYTVTLHFNSGTDDEGNLKKEIKVPYKKTIGDIVDQIEKPNQPQSASISAFKGWVNANVNNSSEITSDDLMLVKPTKDMTYIALWDGPMIELLFNNHVQDNDLPISYSIPELVDGAIPATPNVIEPIGRHFSAWKVSNSNDNQFAVGKMYSNDQMFDLRIMKNVSFQAVFEGDKLPVVFELNGGNLVLGNVNQDVEYGKPPTSVIVEKTGYVLDGWLNMNNGVVVNQLSMPTQSIDQATTYVAQWKEDYKEIKLNANGGKNDKTLSIRSGSKWDSSLSVAPIREGYNFIGWASSKELADKGVADVVKPQTITANSEYFAVWSNVKFKVVFQNEDGTEIQSKDIIENEKIGNVFMNQPVGNFNPNKTFKGWKVDGNITLTPWASIKDIVVKQNHVITAVLSDNEYKLHFDVNGGSDGPEDIKGTVGKEVILGEYKTPKGPAGYKFKGWFDAREDGKEVFKYTFGNDYEVYAQYEADKAKYSINYFELDPDEINYQLVGTEEFEGKTESIPTFEAIKKTGFVIEEDKTKYSTSNSAETNTVLAIAGDGSLEINLYFKRNTYNVTYVVTGVDENVVPDEYNGTFKYGEKVTLYGPTEKEGYGFEGWFINGVTIEDNTFIMPANNVIIEGKLIKGSYSVRYELDSVEGNSIIDNNRYSIEDVVELPKKDPVKAGYTFTGWTIDDNAVSKKFTMPAKDVVVKANWERDEYKIAFVDDTKTIKEMKSFMSDEITLIDPPKNDEAKFLGWQLEGVLYPERTTYTVYNDEIEFKAKWDTTPTMYQVKYHLDDGQNYAPASYVVGNKNQLIPASREGYEFEGWYLDKNYKTKVEEIKKNNEEDLSVYAKWSKKKQPENNDKTIFVPSESTTVIDKETVVEKEGSSSNKPDASIEEKAKEELKQKQEARKKAQKKATSYIIPIWILLYLGAYVFMMKRKRG